MGALLFTLGVTVKITKKLTAKKFLADLGTIDEDLDEIGIMMVTTKDTEVASEMEFSFLSVKYNLW